MQYIEKSHLLNEKELDQKYYFQSLFQKAAEKGLLTEEEIKRIQTELIDLMGKEVERYTNDESSSIRIEKAQELLQSITYNIGYFLKSTTDVTQKLDILKKEKVSELFYQGMIETAACKKRAESLYLKLSHNDLRIDNYAYQDTVFTAMPGFFHDYEIEFAAHEIPASIDYPLFEWKDELVGVEYIYDYLYRLTLEDSFLRQFSSERINRLLTDFDRDYTHLLVNIFELVMNNAIGCILSGKSCLDLMLSTEELLRLQDDLKDRNPDELALKVMTAYEGLKEELQLNEQTKEYIRTAVIKLLNRIQLNLEIGTLKQVFITMAQRSTEEYFIDGPMMADDTLRKLIETLRNKNSTEEKVELLKEYVHSTADLIELLEESFREEEYAEVLAAFPEEEREMLRRSILNEYPVAIRNDFEPQNGWQRLLFKNR